MGPAFVTVANKKCRHLPVTQNIYGAEFCILHISIYISHNVMQQWRIKTNDELRQRMKHEDIIKFIKSQRLRWVAHVMRMENTRTTRKLTEWKPHKTRPVGRPRLRWLDQVEEDLRRMKITGWRVKIEDTQVWNRNVKQTKTHPRFYSQQQKKTNVMQQSTSQLKN